MKSETELPVLEITRAFEFVWKYQYRIAASPTRGGQEYYFAVKVIAQQLARYSENTDARATQTGS